MPPAPRRPVLDESSRRNLEADSRRDSGGRRQGSLLDVIDGPSRRWARACCGAGCSLRSSTCRQMHGAQDAVGCARLRRSAWPAPRSARALGRSPTSNALVGRVALGVATPRDLGGCASCARAAAGAAVLVVRTRASSPAATDGPARVPRRYRTCTPTSTLREARRGPVRDARRRAAGDAHRAAA